MSEVTADGTQLAERIHPGWAVLVGTACRTVWERVALSEGMDVVGAGVIAGDALFAFFTSTWQALLK